MISTVAGLESGSSSSGASYSHELGLANRWEYIDPSPAAADVAD